MYLRRRDLENWQWETSEDLSDSWLPRAGSLKSFRSCLLGNDARVSQLITELGGWNMDFIRSILSLDEVKKYCTYTNRGG